MKHRSWIAFATAALLAGAALAQPSSGTQRPSDARIPPGAFPLVLPYDGDIHPIDLGIPGEALSIYSMARNAAPVTAFTPDAGDGFFFEASLIVHPGFAGTIDFDHARSYFVHMPLIPGAFATLFVAAGTSTAAADPGTLAKEKKTDVYSGSGKNIKKKVTVTANSDCPVTLATSTGKSVTVQPGFSGEVEEPNDGCKKVKIQAKCDGEAGDDCTFSVS